MRTVVRAPSVLRIAAAVVLLSSPLLRADVFYSGLQDIPLATDFAGTYLNVDNGATNGGSGWDLNVVFGGAQVYNSDRFQPARVGTGNEDAIIALSAGTTVNASLIYSTGFGASGSHLGPAANQFQPGQEEYIGFSFLTDANSGPHYGWMRVVFTAGQLGGVIKDWGYESGVVGAAPKSINTGNILQAAPSGGVSVVTVTSASGQSSMLASTLSDTGSGNVTAVSKTGGGNWTLSGNQPYTGRTTVQANGGTLEVGAANGKLSGTMSVTVNGGGTLLLSGPGGTNAKLNHAAAVTLAGGRIDLSGMTSSLNQTVGMLTLSTVATASAPTLLGDETSQFHQEAAVITAAEVEPAFNQMSSTVDNRVGAVTLRANWATIFRAMRVGDGWNSADDPAPLPRASETMVSRNGGIMAAATGTLLAYPSAEAASTAAVSTLDFGGLLTGNTWTFGASNATWSGVQLSITNYTAGVDHLFFGSGGTGLNAAQLDQILFYSDSGSTFLGSAQWLGGTGEVVPVPEPGTWAGAVLAVGAVAFMRRQRRTRSRR